VVVKTLICLKLGKRTTAAGTPLATEVSYADAAILRPAVLACSIVPDHVNGARAYSASAVDDFAKPLTSVFTCSPRIPVNCSPAKNGCEEKANFLARSRQYLLRSIHSRQSRAIISCKSLLNAAQIRLTSCAVQYYALRRQYRDSKVSGVLGKGRYGINSEFPVCQRGYSIKWANVVRRRQIGVIVVGT